MGPTKAGPGITMQNAGAGFPDGCSLHRGHEKATNCSLLKSTPDSAESDSVIASPINPFTHRLETKLERHAIG